MVPMKKVRYIVHVDMDAFFAAVEQRDNSDYRGKPVIVGADPKEGKGRGVVAACSYEARKYGIHSALPISIAYRKCPQGIYLFPDGKKYARESAKVFEILRRFTPDVEPVSIDEAFLDITSSYHLFADTPQDTCRLIKFSIKEETGLTASIGMAPNKMTAKIASDLEKPNGFVMVNQEKLLDFLHPLSIERLWGVGEKTKKTFHEMGINTIGDIASQDLFQFTQRFGKHGEHIWKLASGIDPRDVKTVDMVKSVSNEHTFDKDTGDKKMVQDVIMQLSEKVSRRLRKADLKGQTITLKVRFEDFKTYTRAATIDQPTNYVEDIYSTTSHSLEGFYPEKKKIRLVGVGVSNMIKASYQPTLFEQEEDQSKKERLHKAVDEIKDKFGDKSIKHRK